VAALLMILTVLPGCVRPRATVTIRFEPHVPLVNEMVVFEATAEAGATVYEWTWTFGDGETVDGQRAWHVYHSINTEGDAIAPWKVTVTAVDDRGRVSSAAEYVQVQPYTGNLAAYSVLAVGLTCHDCGTREPEIPPAARLEAQGDSVLDKWWDLPANRAAYFVVKFHMIPFAIDEVACTWTLYSLGTDGTQWPVELDRIDGGTWPNFDEYDPDERDDWYYDHIGFVFELDPVSRGLKSGWYLLFAEATASRPATPDRTVCCFRIYVEGTAGGQ
jgi:hypothetical protein